MEIITNEAVIAVSQDASGSPASRLWKVSVAGGDISLWLGGLSDGYVLFR
jgi:alpha-galactosidase